MGHGALQHSPAVKNGVASSPALNVTFVEGIIGQFIQCDNEQKQKSGIKREKGQQTSELVTNTMEGCVCVCVCDEWLFAQVTNNGVFTQVHSSLGLKVAVNNFKLQLQVSANVHIRVVGWRYLFRALFQAAISSWRSP